MNPKEVLEHFKQKQQDDARRLMAEAQFAECDSYINHQFKSIGDMIKDAELRKMKEDIEKLPVKDEEEYYCPDCNQSDFTENHVDYCGVDSLYSLECNICGHRWTPDYLKAHGYFIKKHSSDAFRKVGPVRDETEYYCPDCKKFEFAPADFQMDYNRNTVLTCKLCDENFTIGYLEDHGFYREDKVNHPEHYISKDGVESIDVIRAFTRDLEGIEAVCSSNILKYIMRWKHKNGLEDLKKARWYLDYLITEVEENNND